MSVINADARRRILAGLDRDELEAMVLYLTEIETDFSLDELVASTRWQAWVRWPQQDDCSECGSLLKGSTARLDGRPACGDCVQAQGGAR